MLWSSSESCQRDESSIGTQSTHLGPAGWLCWGGNGPGRSFPGQRGSTEGWKEGGQLLDSTDIPKALLVGICLSPFSTSAWLSHIGFSHSSTLGPAYFGLQDILEFSVIGTVLVHWYPWLPFSHCSFSPGISGCPYPGARAIMLLGPVVPQL